MVITVYIPDMYVIFISYVPGIYWVHLLDLLSAKDRATSHFIIKHCLHRYQVCNRL